jgi:DNA-binding MarR family transcriptional regulator
MNEITSADIPDYQSRQFQLLIARLFQCCQERMQYQSERFGLPDAELRCLTLFEEERYLTAKTIAYKMNVVKSRVTKIIEGLVRKGLVQRIKDPEDSRIRLISLTPKGQKKLLEVGDFQTTLLNEVLRQIAPEQRKTMLTNLELLKASMESVREWMV